MDRPNIVFILADDLGCNDLSCEGSTFYESPNIDCIAAGGMKFTQGYASCQVCSPSRASILTGKVPPRHGITDYIGAATGESWRELNRHTKMLPPEYERGLRFNEIPFPQVLYSSGYQTFFAGKWHLGDIGQDPEQFGFETNIGGWKVGQPRGGYFSPYDNPRLTDGPAGESLPIRLATETASWITKQKDSPFLAYLSFYSVHGPIQTSQKLWKKYQEKALELYGKTKKYVRRFSMDGHLPVRQIQDCPIYAGMIEAMDDAVGIVLKTLSDLGLEDNTIICFTSDNGGASSGEPFATSNLPLRGGKGRQWEAGIREPFYIKVPGMTDPGMTCNTPVSFIDFYPTFLELTDCEIPQQQTIDGLSLVPLLDVKKSCQANNQQRRSIIKNRDLFWHYPHYGNQGGDPSCIIRRKNWKLIHYFEDGHDELYDLNTDPCEQFDISATYESKTTEMRASLDEWLREVKAQFPRIDPNYNPESARKAADHIENIMIHDLEEQHADFLNPSWSPNADWWQSQLVID